MALDIASAMLSPMLFAWPILESVGVLADMSSPSSLVTLLTVLSGVAKPKSCSV